MAPSATPYVWIVWVGIYKFDLQTESRKATLDALIRGFKIFAQTLGSTTHKKPVCELKKVFCFLSEKLLAAYSECPPKSTNFDF